MGMAYEYGATKDEVDAALDEDEFKAALVDLVLSKVPPKECSELCQSVRRKWEKVNDAANTIAVRFSDINHSFKGKVKRMAKGIAKPFNRMKDKITGKNARSL